MPAARALDSKYLLLDLLRKGGDTWTDTGRTRMNTNIVGVSTSESPYCSHESSASPTAAALAAGPDFAVNGKNDIMPSSPRNCGPFPGQTPQQVGFDLPSAISKVTASYSSHGRLNWLRHKALCLSMPCLTIRCHLLLWSIHTMAEDSDLLSV